MIKILNLIRPEQSEIGFKIYNFPDGEVQIDLDGEDITNSVDHVKIVTRICNQNDLFIIEQVCTIFDNMDITYDLMISYLTSQRMDREMSIGRACSLDIVLDRLGSFLNYKEVYVLEIHNPCSLIPRKGFHEVYGPNDVLPDECLIVYPDKGARLRYSEGDCELIIEKKRDDTGKIQISVLRYPEIPSDLELWVVDDLCDGGGTFLTLKNEIRKIYPKNPINLLVTHMVNKDGLKRVSEAFNKVIITNSYKDWDLKDYRNVKCIDIVDYLVEYRTDYERSHK